MMLHGLALAVFLGSAWSMPLGMDEAMRDLAIADMEVTNFYSALEKKDFDQLPELYEKLIVARPTLQAALAKLQKTDPGRGLQSLKRLLDIQLDTVLLRINGLLPYTNGGGPEQPQQPQYNTPESDNSGDDDDNVEKKYERLPKVKAGKKPGKKFEKSHENKPEKKLKPKKDLSHHY